MHISDTLKKGLATAGALVSLLLLGFVADGVGAATFLNSPQDAEVLVTGSASLDAAQNNVTITVDGRLDGGRSTGTCAVGTDSAHWWDGVATALSPVNRVEIISGQFNGSTITTTTSIEGEDGSCVNGNEYTRGSLEYFDGSRTFDVSGLSNGSYTLRVRATSNTGSSDTHDISFVIDRATVTAPTVSISANPTTITEGGSTTLTWTTGNSPTSCTASGGWSGSKSVAGSSETLNNITRPSSGSRTYTITCENSGGSVSDSVTVTINTSSTLICSASPTTVETGQDVTFTASGGSGTYSWTGGGTPATAGDTSTFTTSYNVQGEKTATVTRGGVSATCSVDVLETNAPLQCFPATQTVDVNEWADTTLKNPSTGVFTGSGSPTTFTSSPGAGAGNSRAGSTGDAGSSVEWRYVSPGTKTVTITRGSENAQCTISVANANPTGVHETANSASCTISGWAYDADTPSTAPEVVVYSDGTQVGTVTPSSCSGGQCSFTYNLSGQITTGVTHEILVKAKDTHSGIEYNLSSSPKNITCPSSASVAVDLSVRPSGGTYANSATIASGGAVDLWWTTGGSPTSCSVSASPTDASWSGSRNASGGTETESNITTNKTYNISCTNGTSTDNDSITVTVTNTPTVTIDAGTTATGPWSGSVTVDSGDSAWLNWNPSSNATSCTASDGWSGSKSTSGGIQQLSNRIESDWYFIQCSNAAGNGPLDSARINVGAVETGTVVVQSVDINTGASVVTDWSLSGPPEGSQNEYDSSGETYAGMPTGIYNLEAGSPDPVGYDFVSVEETTSQTLTGGGTITFTIYYQEEDGGSGGDNPLECSPENQVVDVGEEVSLEATGGTGVYEWIAAGANPSFSTGNPSYFTTTYSTIGDKAVVLDDGDRDVQCTIEVISGDGDLPQCSDGKDNDGDEGVDWNGTPPDIDCNGPNDNNEDGEQTDYGLTTVPQTMLMSTGSGQSSSILVGVAAAGDFTEDVLFYESSGSIRFENQSRTVTVTGLPGDAVTVFDDRDGDTNQTSDLTLTSSEYGEGVSMYITSATGLSIGDYTLTVTGNSTGGVQRTQEVLLRVGSTIGTGSSTTTPDIEEF